MKQHLGQRATKAQNLVYNTAMLLELIVAGIVIVALLIMFLQVPGELKTLVFTGELNQFLKYMFDIIIGIELLKMLCRHDLDSVVEVLLFSVARRSEEHTSELQSH